MGGQIALRYVLAYPEIFDKLVLSSPLLRIPKESGFIRFGNKMKNLAFMGKSCVARQNAKWSGSFLEGQACKAIAANASEEQLKNPEIAKRYSNNLGILADINCLVESSIDANGKKAPDLRVVCPTSRWLREAFESTDIVMDSAADIITPILIIRSVPDYAVDNDGQKAFCDLARDCTLIDVKVVNNVQAGHELLIETEQIQDVFFNNFDSFVDG